MTTTQLVDQRRSRILAMLLACSTLLCMSLRLSLTLAETKQTQEDVVEPTLHRRLSGEREDCPEDSIWHCDNPAFIPDDPTIGCDWDTCQWNMTLLDPEAAPKLCKGIEIVADQVEDLSDFLEPCLWWNVLYGDLQPTPGPSLTNTPTVAPTNDPANAAFETAPQPSLLESSTEQGTAPVLAPSRGGVASSMTRPSVPFETMLVTYIIAAGRARRDRRYLRGSLTSPTRYLSGEGADAGDSSRLSLIDWDRVELHVITTEHVKSEFARLIGDAAGRDFVHNIHLVLTTVQQTTVGGSGSDPVAFTVTQALDGQVVFAHDLGQAQKLADPAIVEKMLEQAFQESALERYLAKLQASTDTTLQRTLGVHLGLPTEDETQDEGFIDPNGPVATSASGSPSSDGPVFEWNTFWIAIIAGGAVGLCGLCTGCILLCWRHCHRRRQRKLSEQETDDNSSTGKQPVEPLPSTKSSDTKQTFSSSTTRKTSSVSLSAAAAPPTESRFVQPMRFLLGSAGITDRVTPRLPASTRNANLLKERDDDPEGSDNDDGSENFYQSSEVTSVYSYIDTNLNDDQSFSIAPSMLYGSVVVPDGPGDDGNITDSEIEVRHGGDDGEGSVLSRMMWSVADGISLATAPKKQSKVRSSSASPTRPSTTAVSSTPPKQPSPKKVSPTRSDHAVYMDEDNDSATALSQDPDSPTKMVVFADGDDEEDMSMVSEHAVMSTGMPPTRRDSTGQLCQRMDSWSLTGVENQADDTSAADKVVGQPALAARAPLADLSRVDESFSSKNSGSCNPNNTSFCSVTSLGAGSFKENAINKVSPAGKAKKTAPNGISSSTNSDGSQGSSTQPTSSSSTTVAANNNSSSRNSVTTDSDDESSLFMGPNNNSHNSSTTDGASNVRKSRLTAASMVATGSLQHHENRMVGPLPRGSKMLTDKERVHMGLSVRRKHASPGIKSSPTVVREDEEDGETDISGLTRSFQLPANYDSPSSKMAATDESYDAIATMASF